MNPWAAPLDVASATVFPDSTAPQARGERPVRPLADLGAGVLAGLGVLLFGAPVGIVWSWVAPRAAVVAYGGGKGADFVHAEPREFIAADGTFLLLTFGVGIAVGVLAWRLGRRYGPGVVVGLAVGAILAALVAAEVGTLPGYAAFRFAVTKGPAAHLDAPIRLRATAAVVGWPVGAMVGFWLLNLRRPSR
ncbi:MAG: DUF2567 domain-containing protein [Actinomycetota bacterium]|nr:DUF2567 domain-containing protein [Actinomycetota bacterium]